MSPPSSPRPRPDCSRPPWPTSPGGTEVTPIEGALQPLYSTEGSLRSVRGRPRRSGEGRPWPLYSTEGPPRSVRGSGDAQVHGQRHEPAALDAADVDLAQVVEGHGEAGAREAVAQDL